MIASSLRPVDAMLFPHSLWSQFNYPTMVYNHRQIEHLASRLQRMDPLSPVQLASNRAQFVYLAATLFVLSEVLGESVGNLAKATLEDNATAMIGPKAYSFGWKLDPLHSHPLNVRLRRTCYALGFLLRDINPAAVFSLVLLLVLLVIVVALWA